VALSAVFGAAHAGGGLLGIFGVFGLLDELRHGLDVCEHPH
jgi:hypothetical protein